ncbi:DNA/RNA non-specific endonuclease [Moraxella sp. TY5]
MQKQSLIAILLPVFSLVGCGGSGSNPVVTQPTPLPTPTTNQCDKQLLDQTQPIISEKLAQNAYPLCFDGFKVMYSGVSKTPIWVAEYLTRQRLTYAKSLVREDNFHEETQLPVGARSYLADYSNSGYDRGHLAPNADMSNKTSQYNSFSLANIAPQNPTNNRQTWVKIENKTRELTNQYASSYVVTGVAFLDPRVKMLNNNVFIPTHFFKAVYLPSQAQAVAFISPNDASNTVEAISLNELAKRTGVDAFPNLPYAVKSMRMTVNLDK